jgi:hypothetical protein
MDYCPGNDYDYTDGSSGTPGPVGGNATKYVVNGTTYYGVFNGWYTCAGMNATISKSGLPFDVDAKLYYIDIQATGLMMYAKNGFRVLAPGSVAVAQIGDSSGNTVSIRPLGVSTPASNFRYNIKFGSDCSVKTTTRQSLYFYDMDNAGGAGAQPDAEGNVTINLFETLPGGAETQVRLYKGATSYLTYTPPNIDDTTTTVDFDAKPGAKYRVQINNVYYNNIIQTSTPYDGIFFQRPCIPPDLTLDAGSCPTISGTAKDEQYPSNNVTVTVKQGATVVGTDVSNAASGYKWSIPMIGTEPLLPLSYTVTAVTSGVPPATATITRTLGPCVTATCGPNPLSGGLNVGTPQTFKVSMTLSQNWASPPYSNSNPALRVTLKDPDGLAVTTVPVTGATNVAYSGSGNTITSTGITFTPTKGGTYNLSYSLSGYVIKTCGATGDAAYSPYFSVTGGDVVAGAGFGNGTCTENATADIKGRSTNAPLYSGAGAEQAAWSTGTISNFVSGMGLGGGAATNSGFGLSFANVGGANTATPNYGGSFDLGIAAGTNSLPCTPNYFASATGSNAGNNYSVNGIAANSGVVNLLTTVGGPFMFNGGVLQPGNTVNLYYEGDVLITGDLTYGAYTLNDIPRFSLHVKGNIYIAPGVHDLYGVYTAQKSATGGGHIITCANNVGDVTIDTSACNSQLRFHGSVASEDTMTLTRTFGNIVAAPSVTADPAEVFDYPPELWLSAPGTVNASVQSYTSLPPVL